MKPVVLYLALGFVLLVLLCIGTEVFLGGAISALLARLGWTTIRSLRKEQALGDDLAQSGTVFRTTLDTLEQTKALEEAARLAEQARIYDAINKSVESASEDTLREDVLKNIEEAGQ